MHKYLFVKEIESSIDNKVKDIPIQNETVQSELFNHKIIYSSVLNASHINVSSKRIPFASTSVIGLSIWERIFLKEKKVLFYVYLQQGKIFIGHFNVKISTETHFVEFVQWMQLKRRIIMLQLQKTYEIV